MKEILNVRIKTTFPLEPCFSVPCHAGSTMLLFYIVNNSMKGGYH